MNRRGFVRGAVGIAAIVSAGVAGEALEVAPAPAPPLNQLLDNGALGHFQGLVWHEDTYIYRLYCNDRIIATLRGSRLERSQIAAAVHRHVHSNDLYGRHKFQLRWEKL